MGRKEETTLLKYLRLVGNKISRFVTSKDVLIFLFFLVMSTGMWTLHALRKEYETIIIVPIAYEKAPKGFLEQADLPKKLMVTVTDNGTSLVRYRWMHSFSPISIDVSGYTDSTYSLQTAGLESEIQKQLNTSTKIVRISPGQIKLDFQNLTKKEVPVEFKGSVFLADQYMKNGEMEIHPKTVTLYGSKDNLKNIDHIETEFTKLDNVKGNINIRVTLKASDSLAFSQDTVNCILRTERFTDKTVEVPIRAISNKAGYKLRTFPVTAKVVFHIGLSNYDKVRAEDLTVSANSEDASGSRIPLRTSGKENLIKVVDIIPDEVEYVLERND